MKYTTFDSVKDKFYSLIITGESLPGALVDEWLGSAMGEYELELGEKLEYEEVEIQPEGSDGGESLKQKRFTTELSSFQKSLLGRYMQREFITRELSRYSKITGIDSKDEKVSGLQATKYTLRSELEMAQTSIAELVFKMKKVS